MQTELEVTTMTAEEEAEKESEARLRFNRELADEVADELAKGLYPMDIWEVGYKMLEEMCERGGIGFNHCGYMRAVIPVLLDQYPENYEGVYCFKEAVRKYKQESDDLRKR